MRSCPSCHSDNPPHARFCLECGAPLSVTCSSCGTELPPASKFCLQCGHKVDATVTSRSEHASDGYTPKHLAEKILTSRAALEGERKQVSVLFCDIVGSTALAERLGEESMHAMLNRFFELAMAVVHRYEGTVNQFLGDGFMALFGAPLAHEDHARRAVLAALDVRSAIVDEADSFEELEVRMGLNTGPVVVGKIGDNLRMDYTAVGDTTNLAARLQQHADPGAIFISEVTRHLVEGYVRTEPVAVLEVKGKTEPIAAFSVLGRGQRKSPLDLGGERQLSRFVGRVRDMTSLTDVLTVIRAGQGQVVGVVGEPGVGKSRLLHEFRKSVSGDSITYIEGRCLSYGSAVPYLPIVDLLRARCDISEADTDASIVGKLQSALHAVGMDDEALPYVLVLFGVKDGTAALREMSPETVKSRTVQTLIRLIVEGSRREPLVLAIEDLHWIDNTSEQLLVALVENVAHAAVLVIGTYRPGYRPPWMDQSFATQLALRPLSAADSQSLVTSAVGSGSIVDDLAESIIRKGDGNPLFLEELARNVANRGHQSVLDAIPDTIQDVLVARIDRLPASAKHLLHTASVLGREVPLRLLREIHDAPDTLEADLHDLKHQEFLYEKRGSRETVFVFKHVLTQEAAYESMLSVRRATLHEAAGWALERLYADRLEEQYELLAFHYPRSPNLEKGLEYLIKANRKAIGADALFEAKSYFEQAMALLDTLADTQAARRQRLALLVDQIVIFQNLFKMREYSELLVRYEPVAVALNDPEILGPMAQQIGHCDWTFGRFEQANKRLAAAAELLEASGNYDVAAQTYQIWMYNHLCLGNFLDVLGLLERAESAWKKQPNLRWYVYALCAAAGAYSNLGRFQKGIDLAHKALDVAERFKDSAQVSFAAWSLGLAYIAKGSVDAAVRYGVLGVEKAPTPAERAWAEHGLAVVQCRVGQFDEAADLLAPWLEILRTNFIPSQRFAPYLGEAYLRAGKYEQAQQALKEGLEVQATHGMRYETAMTRRLLAELAMSMNPAQADEPLAEPHLRKCIASLESLGAEPELARAWVVYGRLEASQGNISEARKWMNGALEVFERLGVLGETERLEAEINSLPSA